MAQDKITIGDFQKKMQTGQKITMMTAYDYPTASLVDQAEIDTILVGDSLGMVVLGYDSTVPVTMDEMIHHCKAVRRGTKRAFVVGDMPFMSYQVSLEKAVENAGRFIKEAGCECVKLEGGTEMVPVVEAICTAGIPVCAQAAAALSEAQKHFERINRLHEIRAVSNSAYDAAERQMSTANARMVSAKQRLELAKKGPRDEDVGAARAQLGQAEAALALTEDRLKKSNIRTPINGIIAYRDVEEGEVIPAGTPITSVIGLDRLKIKISLNERDLQTLSNKKDFNFTVDAIPHETFFARVFFLSPTAESGTRFFPMELVVENPDPRMADGMTARIKFPIRGKKKSIKIPASWLAEQNGQVGLFVVKNGKALFKPVRLGSYYDNRVEILSGLSNREHVVTNPAGLRDGEPVEMSPR